MNIHEYQAKELFAEFGVPISRGFSATSLEEVDSALAQLPETVVVKAQIHAGGRGKGTFADGFQGGVKIAHNHAEAREQASRMLGNRLITHQTGPAGRVVKTLYLCEACSIANEYYLALVIDRRTSRPVIIASTEGGVEIETVARENPEKITRVGIDPLIGLRSYQARAVAKGLGLTGGAANACVKMLDGLYRLFMARDCSLVEVNPLVTTTGGALEALDAKMSFDDNALYRQPSVRAMRDLNEEDPKEIRASDAGLNYVALDGTIACLVNGAGLAMSTMDIIQYHGGEPANFLDVGGGANEEQVTEAFRIILSDTSVRGILVNIFGGIMKCDIIAKGIIAAAQNVQLDKPLVVRLEGTNVKEGKRLLQESGLQLVSAESLTDAASRIVELAAKQAAPSGA